MIEKIAAEEGAEAMIIAAKTEEDIASLDSYEDKKLFLDELGLEQSGVNRLIKKAYHLLNHSNIHYCWRNGGKGMDIP